VFLCLSIISKDNMCGTRLEISDAVDIFVRQPMPILFVDTCALLDIIRLPFREKNPKTAMDYFCSVKRAIELTISNRLRIVLLPNVPNEYRENFQKTKDELSRHIEGIDKNLEVLGALHGSSGNQLPVSGVSSLKTEKLLENICKNLIEICICISQDDTLVVKANDRVVQNIPPSRKGSIKDCIIFEHAVKIGSLLRKKSFTDSIVFLTSNTKDYCDSGYAKQRISDELGGMNIGLCLNWSWAVRDVMSFKEDD